MSRLSLFEEVFRLEGAHGRVLGVRVDLEADDDSDALHPEEASLVSGATRARRRLFAGGRHALRTLLDTSAAIGRDERGAPRVEGPFAGSISHKDSLAGALISVRTNEHLGVGIDLEIVRPLRFDIRSRVFTDEELARADGGTPTDEEVLRTFSAKEAIYKAIDPFVRRYVGFREVEIHREDDAKVTVRFVGEADLRTLAVEITQLERDTVCGRVIVSTARAVRG